jgi:hypothetical protein
MSVTPCRYYDAQVKCPVMSANGTVMSSSVGQTTYIDYYYENANSMDTKNCYGYIQATYTSDGGEDQIESYCTKP